MKLFYSPNLNPRVAVAVARYLKSPVEYVRASPRHPEHLEAFKAINPNGLVPVLMDGDHRLWETDAIACRLSQIAKSEFWRTGTAQSEMIMWMSWNAYHFTLAASPLYFHRLIVPMFSDEPAPQELMDQSLKDFRAHAAVLDAHLKHRPWMLGDHISYADFRVATPLPFADGAGLPLSEFPNIQRWHDRLMQIDAWRDPFSGLE